MRKIVSAFVIMLALSVANVCNAAILDRACYLGSTELNYPLIVLDNVEVAAKINNELRDEVTRFVVSMQQNSLDNEYTISALAVDYVVTCNRNGILSVVFNEFVNFERAAHPSTFKRGLNFRTDSGERITSESLTEYSPTYLTQKLREYSSSNGQFLFGDFQQLDKIPEDFYYDEDLHVHIILQQYEVAPYAAGIIEFDATAED